MNKINHIENISKFQAAERQLKTAISLFFVSADAVSIHALASNAHSILSDIAKVKGIQCLKNSDVIRPETKTEFINILHGPQNFFKHASKDPDETIDFRPAVTPHYIFESLLIIAQIQGVNFTEANFFLIWYYLKNPSSIQFELVSRFVATFKQPIPDNLEIIWSECRQFFIAGNANVYDELNSLAWKLT